ncbi:MAG: protein kinase [Polyangiaceae bacterium]
MSLQTGQIIDGKYRIVRVLGQGGMGAVYEGENTRIHRRVAIKVLHASVATKADIVQRFEREAQAAGRIGSEHIVEVLDLGSLPSGERFMVMEYLDGEPLGERIKSRGRLPAMDVALLLEQLLEGLGAAHNAGIVHRDLKPDNVFLLRSKGGQKDFVKLVDFGVSKFSALDAEFSMTRTGAVMGTPFYMSPEQARGQTVDHRSDLYSVGVVGYQMITGRVPFNADTFNELLFKIALESPEPAELLAPGLDPNFSAIVMRGMARDLNHRFQTAEEFRNAIGGWLAQNGHALRASQASVGYGQVQQQQSYGTQVGPLGQSGSGPHQWATGSAPNHPAAQFQNSQPGPELGGSLSGGSQPGHPQAQPHAMSQSQVALAVTTGQPNRSGAVIAAVLAMAVLGVGGGFAAFKYAGAKNAAGVGKNDSVASQSPKSDPPKTDPSAMPSKADPTPSSAAPTPPPTDSAKVDDPKPADSVSTPDKTSPHDPIAKQIKLPEHPVPGKLPTATPAKDPGQKTPTPPPGGRSIDGSL